MKVEFVFCVLLTGNLLFEGTASPVTSCAGTSSAKYEYVNLPGIGWDNLLNENRGKVIQYKYSECKTTGDGRYLIPDNVFVVPMSSSNVDIFSDIIDNWTNYTSMTSKSINVGGNAGIPWIFSIHGSYSSEYQEVKTDQVNDNSVTVRVGARYEKYVAKLQSDATLDDTFKERVLSIAGHLLFGRKHTARYESQLLIRDFGTHMVTSVDAGAAIYKIEQLNRTAVQHGDITKSGIAESAGISFFGSGVNFNHGTTTTDSTVTKYLSLRSHSSVRTHGGPPFKPVNFSINEWVDGIGDNIVAIDRSGDPLNFLVNTNTFPLLPISLIEQVASVIQEAIVTYYKYNTIKGCTNVNSPNFNVEANVDDGSCYDAGKNLTFGGVYQTCDYTGDLSHNLCNDLTTVNPKTGSNACPEGYEAVPLFNGNTSKTETNQECDSYFVFWKKCHNIHHYGSASYNTYWCAAVKDNVPDDSGYLFGGIYTSVLTNPLAKAHSCPPAYKPLHITTDLSICVSDDYENGERYSAPFGGLFSCQQGNVLANKYYTPDSPPKMCPSGYSEHLATVDEGCEISYCVKMKSSAAETLPVKSPPFIKQRLERNENDSFIVSNEGQSWTNIYLVPDNFSGFASDVKGWITNDGKDLNVSGLLGERSDPTVQDHNQKFTYNKDDLGNDGFTKLGKSPRKMTKFEIVILVTTSVISTLLCVMVATFAILKIRQRRVRKIE